MILLPVVFLATGIILNKLSHEVQPARSIALDSSMYFKQESLFFAVFIKIKNNIRSYDFNISLNYQAYSFQNIFLITAYIFKNFIFHFVT